MPKTRCLDSDTDVCYHVHMSRRLIDIVKGAPVNRTAAWVTSQSRANCARADYYEPPTKPDREPPEKPLPTRRIPKELDRKRTAKAGKRTAKAGKRIEESMNRLRKNLKQARCPQPIMIDRAPIITIDRAPVTCYRLATAAAERTWGKPVEPALIGTKDVDDLGATRAGEEVARP